MEYKSFIENFNLEKWTPDRKGLAGFLQFLFADLRDHNFSRQNLTEENINAIIKRTQNDRYHDWQEIDKARWEKYTLRYIEYYSDLFLEDQVPEKKPKIKEKLINEDELLDLKPEDCKKKEYDWEFIKFLGIENPE